MCVPICVRPPARTFENIVWTCKLLLQTMLQNSVITGCKLLRYSFGFFTYYADTSQPEWFIVAIKAQNEPFELPMNPIT